MVTVVKDTANLTPFGSLSEGMISNWSHRQLFAIKILRWHVIRLQDTQT